MSLIHALLLFLPLFIVVNLVASVPGREDLSQALRIGLRHTLKGLAIFVLATVAVHFVLGWGIDHGPLF